MAAKDERMRNLEEMMSGIKPIKYNSMEDFFHKRIYEKRQKELRKLLIQVIKFSLF